MPVIWIYEAEASAGIFAEAQARLESAEQDLFNMAVAWGAVIYDGVATYFSSSSQQNPPGGWRPDFAPICVPNPAPGGFEDDDDDSGYAVDMSWDEAYDDSGDDGGDPPDA